MNLLDVNVLVCAHREDALHHREVLSWLNKALVGPAGYLVPDAFHAALAIEFGCNWISLDRVFSRFPDLRWRHPLD